jgi:hypothetical protein
MTEAEKERRRMFIRNRDAGKDTSGNVIYLKITATEVSSSSRSTEISQFISSRVWMILECFQCGRELDSLGSSVSRLLTSRQLSNYCVCQNQTPKKHTHHIIIIIILAVSHLQNSPSFDLIIIELKFSSQQISLETASSSSRFKGSHSDWYIT